MKHEEFDEPLTFEKRGGLAVIDVEARAVLYFGPYLHLVSPRVYSFHFDRDAVWVYGEYPAGGDFNGISRFDRKTGRFTPVLFPRRLWLEDWAVCDMTAAGDTIEFHAANLGEFVCTYRLDKRTLKWRLPEYRWVGSTGASLREAPDADAKELTLFSRDMHYKGRPMDDHRSSRGHPLEFLGGESGWDKVRTNDGTGGWIRADQLVTTLEFVRQTLDAYVAAPDLGSDGPGYFLCRFHFYCSNDDLDEALKMIGEALDKAPAEGKKDLRYLLEVHKDRAANYDGALKRFQSHRQELLGSKREDQVSSSPVAGSW